MKATIYGHFVAGQDEHSIVPVSNRLKTYSVNPILDYSVEEDLNRGEAERRELNSCISKRKPEQKLIDTLTHYEVNRIYADRRYKVPSARTYLYLNKATCEKNAEIFQNSIEAMAGAEYGAGGITTIKFTGLSRPQLLSQLSKVGSSTDKRLYSSNPTTSHNSHSTSTTTIKNKPGEKDSDCRTIFEPLDIAFQDHEAAYRSKTTWQILRAYLVYNLCSINYVVDNSRAISKWGKTILGHKLFRVIMKATFYGHFVAGEDEHSIVPVLNRLKTFGVNPILDYSVEEDLNRGEAERRELNSSISEGKPEQKIIDNLTQYEVNKIYADRRYKVHSARTYFYLNEATCEKNAEIFQNSIEAMAGAECGTGGITAIKLTALGRPQLLSQLSKVIKSAREFVSQVHEGHGNVIGHHLSLEELSVRLEKIGIKDTNTFLENVVRDKYGVIHLFPWSGIVDENFQLSEKFLVPNIREGRMVKLLSQLSKKEEEMFHNMIRRLNTVVKKAKDFDVRLMIDAEQSYFQPAISRITLEMMNRHNRNKAIVYNTYQCYLRETLNEVTTDLEQARRQNFHFGCKLVRGAYMDQERARASIMGYPDPINPTFESTTDMYYNTLEECLRRVKGVKEDGKESPLIEVMVASHNEETVRYAIRRMQEESIPPDSKVVCFGQLLGMCDHMTFPLGQSGYSVYKYIPYGPVDEVMPYLTRRAEENKGVLQKVKKEKRLLLKELVRRIFTGQIFYTPKGSFKRV